MCALLRAERLDDAEHAALAMVDRIERVGARREPALLSIAGALWLIAAVIAARRADRGVAWERLNRADELAQELGDPGEAVRAAESVDEGRLPDGLASRRAQIHLDPAWAHTQRKRDADATLHLLEAERIAPSAVRHNVIAQELVREMLARAKKVRTSALNELALRAGLLHRGPCPGPACSSSAGHPHDPLVDSTSLMQHARRPGWTPHPIDDVGHLLPVEAPELCAQAVSQWLADIRA